MHRLLQCLVPLSSPELKNCHQTRFSFRSFNLSPCGLKQDANTTASESCTTTENRIRDKSKECARRATSSYGYHSHGNHPMPRFTRAWRMKPRSCSYRIRSEGLPLLPVCLPASPNEWPMRILHTNETHHETPDSSFNFPPFLPPNCRTPIANLLSTLGLSPFPLSLSGWLAGCDPAFLLLPCCC